MKVAKLRQTEIIQRYCQIARKEMRRFMPANSCITATRVTCECLKLFGIEAQPLATKFAVAIPRLLLAYSSGLSDEELATARQSRQAFTDTELGWRGHLVARVGDLLLDSSFDQASEALGLAGQFPLEVIALPISGAITDFDASFEVRLDNKELVQVRYVTTRNTGWRGTPAWDDPQAVEFATYLYRLLNRALRVQKLYK